MPRESHAAARADGVPRYIPATYRTDCDGVTLYPLDIYDDALEAASAADHYAERGAEDCREDAAKFQAETQIEDARDTIAKCRSEARALIREIKGAGRVFSPAMSFIESKRLTLRDVKRVIAATYPVLFFKIVDSRRGIRFIQWTGVRRSWRRPS